MENQDQSVADDGVCLTAVQGQMPPAAVHGLARQLAARIDAGLDAPLCASRVVLVADGTVRLKGGRVSKRWRAPELRSDDDDGMARTAAGDRWALGRILLELALGSRVSDYVVDDATAERLSGLKDLERRPLPPSLIVMLAELLERHPEGRAYLDASDNTEDVEERALARFVALQRLTRQQQRPKAVQTRPPVDTRALQRMAREMSGKVSLRSLEGERTGDMPAGAILGRDDLARLGMPRAPLPTQALPSSWARPATPRPAAPAPYDDVEVTVPTEIAALMAPPPPPQAPTWIATVRIEPPATPPPAKTPTQPPTSSTAQTTKSSTKTNSPDAKTTKSATGTTATTQQARRTWSKKKMPRALLAAATLALALLGAAVGVRETQKMTTPAEPLLFER